MDYQNQGYGSSVISGVENRTAEIGKVLKNTYLLLSVSILFSALMAFVGMQFNITFNLLTIIVFFAGAWFLPTLVNKNADSAAGLPWIFAYTGWLGFWLAPILNAYISAGMGMVVMQALGATAVVFLSLSGYAVMTRRDFSFMRGFLIVGMVVLFLVGLGLSLAAALGYQLTAVSLMFSAAACLLMSGVILWQTGEIVNGGETNYIRATSTLFTAIWSLFVNLLRLLGFASGDD